LAKLYFWHEAPLQNPYHKGQWLRDLGVDGSGQPPFYASIGPLFIRPIRPIRVALQGLSSLIAGHSLTIGMHLRYGHNWFDEVDKAMESKGQRKWRGEPPSAVAATVQRPPHSLPFSHAMHVAAKLE